MEARVRRPVWLAVGLLGCLTLWTAYRSLLPGSLQDDRTWPISPSVDAPTPSQPLAAQLTPGKTAAPSAGPEWVAPSRIQVDERNIFFLVLRERSEPLSALEACAIESVVRVHPQSTLYILTTSSLAASDFAYLSPTQAQQVKLVDFDRFLASWLASTDLPLLQKWYRVGEWRKGYVLYNLSNFVRLLVLYLYGGKYFDTDIAHLRNSDAIRNGLATGKNYALFTAAMFFQARHPLMEAVANSFALNFNGTAWAHNGSGQIRPTYRQLCLSKPPATFCDSIQLLPRKSYFGVWLSNYGNLYNRVDRLDLLDDPEVYGVHVWRAMPHQKRLKVQQDSPLDRLARAACPGALAQFGLSGFDRNEGRIDPVG